MFVTHVLNQNIQPYGPVFFNIIQRVAYVALDCHKIYIRLHPVCFTRGNHVCFACVVNLFLIHKITIGNHMQVSNINHLWTTLV